MTESPKYYHGTKGDLQMGDLVEPGHVSNYGKRKQAAFVYLTATLDAAIWGAELAVGAGRGRIYLVEPTIISRASSNVVLRRLKNEHGHPGCGKKSRPPVARS